MATKIGCDSFVYAKMLTEDSTLAAPSYGTITAAPGLSQ